MDGSTPKHERWPYEQSSSTGEYRSDIHEVGLLSAALSVIGDRWSLQIIALTFMHFTRFGELKTVIGINSPILIARLRMLLQNGIIERIPDQTPPKRYEYVLTRKGRDLYPIVMAMVRWADTHMGDGSGRATIKTRRLTSKQPSPTGVRAKKFGQQFP
jgi:DNA-binding HxlR family transcriptional regulator